jgi:RNA polymerase sigma-70 factor (ECF subfamily)
LVRLRAQDEPAWREFASLYAPLVVRWCDRRGLPEADIPDVAQEVFLQVSRSIHGFAKETAADTFRGWLRRITQHEIANHHRRRKHAARPRGGTDAQLQLQEIADTPRATGRQPGDTEETRPGESAPPGPDTDDDLRQERNYLYQRAVQLVRSEFSDAAWQMFWRVAVDGNPATAVAEEFATTAAAVRQNKSRILRRLKQVVGDLAE